MEKSFYYSFVVPEERQKIYESIDFEDSKSAVLNLQSLGNGALFFSDLTSNEILKIRFVCPLFFIVSFNEFYNRNKMNKFNIQTYWDYFSGYDIDFNLSFNFNGDICIINDILWETEISLDSNLLLRDIEKSKKEIFNHFKILYPKLEHDLNRL